MPEAAEVYTTAMLLNGAIAGKTIVDLIWNPTYKQVINMHSIQFPVRIMDVWSWGKKMLIRLESGQCIATSFGLVGLWTHVKPPNPAFTIVLGEFIAPSVYIEDTRYYFSQVRPLGRVVGIATQAEYQHFFKDVGQCIIKNPLSFDQWLPLMTKRHGKMICIELLEQKRLAGVGNYLRADILWYAQIDPRVLVGNLTPTQLVRLHEAMYRVVQKTVRDCGHSIRDWFMPGYEMGGYKTVVYGQDTHYDPLGYKVDNFKDEKDRTVYWSPTVQKHYDTPSLGLLDRFCT